ncbi:MAG: glycogen synthase [Gammaproteobacteria bacterium]|nr:glycogen synthase [Gammaproteobacteria bacterium]
MPPLKICLLASEMMPFAKTGGLADVSSALTREFMRLGHDVRTFLPYYRTVSAGPWKFADVDAVSRVAMPIGGIRYEFSLKSAEWPRPGSRVYFVDCPAMFDRHGLYGDEPDEYRRFLLFTRAVIESCQRLGFSPQVFHCNDWHTALLPLLLRTVYSWDRLFAATRSVLTIHNIGYQGFMPAAAIAELGLGVGEALLDAGDRARGFVNALKTGVTLADAVTTVSPTYAREISSTSLGMGLQDALISRGDGVVGILNGVDYAAWDPRSDAYLQYHFDAEDLAGKAANKRALIAASGLQIDPSVPLIGMVGRLTEQKGIDLLVDSLANFMERRSCAFSVLGAGDARYVEFFSSMQARFPGRFAFVAGYDEAKAHLIEAGSDAFLMPSRYEPCGLNQMYSLRYGTIPIVHRTGGLADSVEHFDPATLAGTGCVFNDYDAGAVAWAIGQTLDWYEDRSLWTRLIGNAMSRDFSWDRQVLQYEALFRRVADGASRA